MRVALPAGFDDEASYTRSVVSEVDELARAAERTESPSARAELLLAAANRILAGGLELPCTERLLQVAERRPAGYSEVKTLLDRADALLETAAVTLHQPASQESGEAERLDDDAGKAVEETSRRLVALRAFAQALRAVLLNGTRDVGVAGNEDEVADVAARSAREAASALSPLLEDRDPRVAAAAGFWQAVLRSDEADPAPALSILGTATADPPEGSMPHAFFSRLLRCRLLAGRGGWAVALTLLMQIEELCTEWYPDETDRAGALRTCALVRIQILTAWHERLSPDTQDEERTWCTERIDRLRAERLSDENATVLRLAPAIPMIATPPELDPPLPDESAHPSKPD